MSTQAAAEYLGNLLNRPLAPDTALRLTSAQRARFQAWLHAQGVAVDDKRLAGEFTLGSLLGAVATSAPAAAVVAAVPELPAAASAGLSIGIDIQSVSELMQGIGSTDYKSEPELLRLFTVREISYAQGRPEPAETLAGLFAAKEAVRKCLGGATLSAEAFRAIEVLPDEQGRPLTKGFEISISHSAGMAVAVACRVALPPASAPAPLSSSSAPVAPPTGVPRWLTANLLVLTALLASLHVWLLFKR